MTQIERLQQSGVRRLGTPQRGFRYMRADGRPVSREERERIEALKIPPARREVVLEGTRPGRVASEPALQRPAWTGRTEDGPGRPHRRGVIA